MVSFGFVYSIFAIVASTILIAIPFTGSYPPAVQVSNLPEQATFDEMHMDNSSYTVWTDEGDKLWDALIPGNAGSVLATNLTSGYHYWGRVSLFHQLQCLRDIRKQLAAMSGSWDASRRLMGNRGSGSDYEEFGFCFDYLRQGILCHADTTLQPVAFNSEWSDGKVVDGNILWHKCKDRNVLYGWADMSGQPRESMLIKEQPRGQ